MSKISRGSKESTPVPEDNIAKRAIENVVPTITPTSSVEKKLLSKECSQESDTSLEIEKKQQPIVSDMTLFNIFVKFVFYYFYR